MAVKGKEMLGLLLAVFGIFLFWATFQNFQQAKQIGLFETASIALGLVFLGLGYYLNR